MASDEQIKKHLGAAAGYVGPVGVKNIRMIADREVPLMVNCVCGPIKKNIIWFMRIRAGTSLSQRLPISVWRKRENPVLNAGKAPICPGY
jgi:hypothetical protein